MAIYEITAPDGRQLEIEGDTPPSEQDLDRIFADMPSYNTNNLPSIQLNNDGSLQQPLQGSVSKRKYLPGQEFFKGITQGVSSLGVGLGKQFGNKMRAMIGKEPLSDEQLNQAYGALDEKLQTPSGKFGKVIGEVAPAFLLPEVKAFQGVGTLSKIGNMGLNGAYQGGTIGALESLKNQGDLSGLGAGAVIGGTLGAGLPFVAHNIRNTIINPAFQKATTKTLETLTSVPQKYSQRALDAELAGNSLFKGKFDADTAYIPIERQLRNAKNMLPTSQDFARTYYNLGQKATEGMKTIKENAGNKITEVLQSLNNKETNNNGIRNAVNTVINKFGEGGIYNSAKRNAPRVTNLLNEELPKEGLTLRDLHRIKEDLYDIGYQAAGTREGTQAEVARGTAEQINNYLRGVAPDYAVPNDQYSLITNIERGLDNENTIANKIRNIGSEQNILSGLDQRLKDVDTLLPKENKFYKSAYETIASENEINNIRNMIGRQYERNPRLLSNRNDELFEQALEDLQKRTNSNFMDELNDIRAREALEHWLPGQGGGSGSSQGFGNLLRTSILGGVPTAAAITHNPTTLLGLLSVSPKFTAQGTIRNLGQLYKATGKEIDPNIIKLLMSSGYALGD